MTIAMENGDVFETDFDFHNETPLPKEEPKIKVAQADKIPDGADLSNEEWNSTWERIVRWDQYGAKTPEDFLKSLPDKYEAFKFDANPNTGDPELDKKIKLDPMYMIRKIKEKPPKLEDLTSDASPDLPITGQQYAMMDEESKKNINRPHPKELDVPGGIGGPGQARPVVIERVKDPAIKYQDKVYTGSWHGEAYINAEDAVGHELKAESAIQGYTTSTGRFVDRHEALNIAKKAEQMRIQARKPSLGLETTEMMTNEQMDRLEKMMDAADRGAKASPKNQFKY